MIEIQNTAGGTPLRMPWKKGIGVGRAYELLRADLLAQLEKLQREIGFTTCRFHGVFHDEMGIVRRRPDGKLHFAWHHLDKVYDALLRLNLRPFVELGPMPRALASGHTTIFEWRMNVTPPKVMAEWGELVGAFARHLIERYGRDEVRTWNFEVWNEPNLPGFWTGTKEDYWELYRSSAQALKAVDPELKVGGPSTSKAEWIADFLAWTSREKVPVDFLSTHLYPQDEWVLFPEGDSPHQPGTFFGKTVRGVRDLVKKSARPDLPIHWTEFNSLAAEGPDDIDWLDNAHVDDLSSGSFVARQGIELDAVAESFSWWTASDVFEEAGIPLSPFSGTYGLMTVDGLPKASYHAFSFLNRMRGKTVTVRAEPLPPGCGLGATRADEPNGTVWRVLLWNDAAPGAQGPAWTDSLHLDFLDPAPCKLIASKIGAGHGSCYETWLSLGRPQNLSPSEEILLRAHAEPACELVSLPDGSRVPYGFSLAANEVMLLEFSPVTDPSGPKGILSSEAAQWNKAMGEKSR